MSRLTRTIFIVLCSVAGTNSSDLKYHSRYLKDRNVFDFCNLGNDTVREITLLIKITSSRPKMEIKLETNEELAETIKRVTVPIWLKGQFGVRNGDFQIGSYRYQRKGGAEIKIDSRNIVIFHDPPLDIARILMSAKFLSLKSSYSHRTFSL